MRVVLSFSLVLSVIVPTCHGISAVITPEDHAKFKKGYNLTLDCTLLDSSDSGTAADIVWTKDAVPLSEDLYTAINGTVSQLFKSNATFGDSGNYACAFRGESYAAWAVRLVTVAAPPDPPRDLSCSTTNKFDFYCQWWEGLTETNVANEHNVTFKPDHGTGGQVQTIQLNEDGRYSCRFESLNENNLAVTVKIINLVGSAEMKVRLERGDLVVPNPPSNIVAIPGSMNASRYLEVTWDKPADWIAQSGALKYCLRYQNLATQEVVEVSEIEYPIYTLEGLVQNTEYEVSVAARPVTANTGRGDQNWGDWGVTRARTDEGVPFGTPADVRIGLEANGASPELRDVVLQWERLDDAKRGGSYITYEVTLTPQDESRPSHFYKRRVSGIFTKFEDLHKYQTYKVEIRTMNEYGPGPKEDYGNVIPDMTSKPSEPRDLNFTMIDNVIKITWAPPENPHGIVEFYNITVMANATLTSNETGQTGDYRLRVSTSAHKYYVEMNCTDFSEDGKIMQVSVFAVTENFSGQVFAGDPAYSMADGVCAQEPETPVSTHVDVAEHQFNIVLWSVMIPMTVIISCVIVLALWNFFKESLVEPPDPKYPQSLISNGQFRTISYSTEPKEREHFDELRTQKDSGLPEITREGTTDDDPYHHPRSVPKVLRILSHDSGFSGPDSPEAVDMTFKNGSYESEVEVEGSAPIPSISRAISVEIPEQDEEDWRNSVFSSSSDSGAEMPPQLKDGDRRAILSTTSTTVDEVNTEDPYLPVASLPPCPQNTSSSPSVAHSEEPAEERESQVLDDEDVGVPDDDDGYLRQYLLSPTSLHAPTLSDNAYLSMSAGSPPPIGLPLGFFTAGDLAKSSSSPLGEQPSTPDGYQPFSRLEGKKGPSLAVSDNGYVQHENLGRMPVTQPPLEMDPYVKQQMVSAPELEGYVKHPSISSPELDYRDDYMGSLQESGSEKNLCKQEAGGYVQSPPVTSIAHKSLSTSGSSGYSTDSQTPYCKIATEG